MAYENIRLRKPNVTMVDGSFWSVDEDTDSLILKTDDGTTSFSYPLDTTITNTVLSLEYDGYNLWTMEQSDTDQITIRRWYIHNYVCALRNTFDFIPSGSHKYSSEAFTIEHYHTTFSDYEGAGSSILSVSDGSKMVSGFKLMLGPNNNGQIEEVTVSSAGVDYVNINGATQYNHEADTPISFYKNIWLFNNYNGVSTDTGALYKFSAYTGSLIDKYPGGAFKDIKACSFFGVPLYVFDTTVTSTIEPRYNSICYVKGTNMVFLNPDDLDSSYGSMTMDNIEDDQATIIDIYDFAIEGTNVYRLQRKATYYGTTGEFADSTYNYQLSALNAFITSISLNADPAILPANSGGSSSTSDITAIVKDQFNLPIVGRLVYFTEDDPDGYVNPTNDNTDSNGVATTIYTAGTSAREVRLTGTAQQA